MNIDLTKLNPVTDAPASDAPAAIDLTKGANVAIEDSINAIGIGLGWDPQVGDADFDADVSVIAVDENGKGVDFVYFNKVESDDKAVLHSGDNLDGEGDGDDETIYAQLGLVDEKIQKLVVVANIHEADERGQNFGMVSDAFIRVYNAESKDVLVKYDLAEDYSVETAVIVGEFYRKNGVWKFKALGNGTADGLATIISQYGM